MNIAKKILLLLEEKNLSANQLQIACGLSNNAISKWKKGLNNPSLKALKKIADYFNVPVSYFYEEETSNQKTIYNNGIIGNSNSNNTITINGNEPRKLTEIECEILKVCNNLDTRGKNALLNSAYEIENKNNNN